MWGRMAFGGLMIAAVLDFRHHGISIRRNIWVIYSFAFWSLTAFKRASITTPLSSRYVWVGSIILILQVMEYVPKDKFGTWNSRALLSIGSVVVLLATWGSYPLLVEYRGFHRAWSDQSMVRNSILLANRENVEPSVVAHSGVGVPLDTVGDFFKAVDLFGVPDFFSNAAILENSDLSLIAEVSMTELGLMDVTATATPCHEGVAVSDTTIPEGTVVAFRVTRPTTVMISRFVDNQNALVDNIRRLDRGTYSIELGDDGFGLPIRAHFDAEVTRCE